RALRTISGRLQTAAEGAFLARLGGDEFALIVRGGAQPASSAELAERLMAAVADEVEIGGHRLKVGLSIGIAIYPTDGTDASALIGHADAAPHRAHTGGRGSDPFLQGDTDQRPRAGPAVAHGPP